MKPVPIRKSYESEERIAIVAEANKISQEEAKKLVNSWKEKK